MTSVWHIHTGVQQHRCPNLFANGCELPFDITQILRPVLRGGNTRMIKIRKFLRSVIQINTNIKTTMYIMIVIIFIVNVIIFIDVITIKIVEIMAVIIIIAVSLCYALS